MKDSVFSSPSPPSHHHPSYASSNSTRPCCFSEMLMEETIDSAQAIINKWDLDSFRHDNLSYLYGGVDRKDAKVFLEAVSSLQNAMHFYVKQSSNSEKLLKAQKLMVIAMKRLEREFYTILSANRKVLDSESVLGWSSRGSTPTRSSITSFSEDDEVSDAAIRIAGDFVSASGIAMADLKNIADSMIASGYGKECVSIYKITRKSIIDGTLYHLGVEVLNFSQIQKLDWNSLEPKIKTWLHAVKVAVKTLFYGERILCDYVFSSSETIMESCFTEISRDAALNLFNFPENIAKNKKNLSSERIFRALDLYEAVSDLWPDVESIFSHGSLSAVRSQAVAAQVKLGELVRIMLNQFEEAIQKDSSKSSSGGGVHPLTRYVMNFLIFLGDYSGAVSDIVADWPVNGQTPLPVSFFSSPIAAADHSSAAITERLAWLILVLLCKLDSKVELYNDVTLSYLFLANNLNYVVLKVRNSNLGILMGTEWISKNGSKVNQYLVNYEKMGWSMVMSSLPDNPTAEIPPEEVRKCLGKFNLNFEEACKHQSSWVIPDPKLQDEVRISLARKIVPVYRVLYEKYKGKHGIESILRYAPEDLDNYLSGLFSTPPSSSHTSSYQTSPESGLWSHGR